MGWLLAWFLLSTLSRPALAVDSLEEIPKFIAVAQRFQDNFGIALKVWSSRDSSVGASYQVTALKPEHLENVLQVLTWVDVELKRYPAGFLKTHGSRNLVLANAYIPKNAKGLGTAYSPAFIPYGYDTSGLAPFTGLDTRDSLSRGFWLSSLRPTTLPVILRGLPRGRFICG